MTHHRLKMLIVGRHRAMSDIVVRCDPAKIPTLETARPLVVLYKLAFIEKRRRGVDKVNALLLQIRIFSYIVSRDLIKQGITKHAHVKISIAQPFYCLISIPHSTQHNLSV